MSSEQNSQRNLTSAFRAVVGSDMKEWNMTRELAGAKGVIVRQFEHHTTKDQVKIVETSKYDPIDEMDVTCMDVSGSYRGRDVKGRLIIKPMID